MFLSRSPFLALGVAAPLLFSPLFSPAPLLQAQELVMGRLDAVKALLAEDPGLPRDGPLSTSPIGADIRTWWNSC